MEAAESEEGEVVVTKGTGIETNSMT